MLKEYAVLNVLFSLVVAESKMEGFVVGGSFAEIRRHPHMAFLAISNMDENGSPDGFWICSSSVLNHVLILTAGHCLHECNKKSRIIVKLGNADRSLGVLRSVNSFIVHENYDPKSVVNDIALMKMRRPIEFSAKIQRVALMKNPPYSEQAVLAGWGTYDENLMAVDMKTLGSVKLKQVDQTVQPKAKCEQWFKTMNIGTICASARNYKEYPAKGDSGAPLVVRGFIQLGVVSFKNTAIADNIIIYTDVGYFYNWIAVRSQELYCYNCQYGKQAGIVAMCGSGQS